MSAKPGLFESWISALGWLFGWVVVLALCAWIWMTMIEIGG